MLPAPPWVMNNLTLGWARREVCGSHEDNITLGGASSMSVSHFQITLCLSLENTDNIINLLDSGILEAFSTDPNETNMTPSLEFVMKLSKFSGSGLAGEQDIKPAMMVFGMVGR